jgi:two-component system chemotaxis response regulator CheB
MGRDGAAGLAAIRARGGTTIVQDPQDAAFAQMPAAAVAYKGHIVLPLAKIGDALVDLTASKRITSGAAHVPADDSTTRAAHVAGPGGRRACAGHIRPLRL